MIIEEAINNKDTCVVAKYLDECNRVINSPLRYWDGETRYKVFLLKLKVLAKIDIFMEDLVQDKK